MIENIVVKDNINCSEYSCNFESTLQGQNVLVSLPVDEGESLKYGDVITSNNFSFEQITNYANNPSSFRYTKYMISKKITKQFRVENIDVVSHKINLLTMMKNLRSDLITRNKIKYKDLSVWINALVFGEKSFTDDQKEDITLSGINHLFAISGAHVVILIITLELFSNMFNIKEKTKNQIKFFFLSVFVILAGFNYPVCRAIFVELLFIFGSKKYKKSDYLNGLFIFCFILNPLCIFSLSFQLTYYISFILPYLKSPYKNKIISVLYINFIVYILLLPLTLNLSYTINPVAPIITLFITPLVMYILFPLSILVSFFPINGILIVIYATIINILEYSLNIFSFFSVTVGHLNNIETLLCITMVILFLKKTVSIKFYLTCLFLFMLNFNLLGSVSIIDVGQGDAILIKTPFENETIMIDTGPEKSSQELIKYLRYEGVWKIDHLFITHFHEDHNGGYNSIKENMIIENTYYPISDENSDNLINKHELQANDVVSLNNQDITILAPFERDENKNNESLDFIYKTGNYKWYFGGDSEIEVEEEILKNNIDIDVDFYKVSHHGSKSSSSIPFLEALSPKYAIISSGHNNRYNHPAEETIKNLNDQNIKYFDTQSDGLVKFYYLGPIIFRR